MENKNNLHSHRKDYSPQAKKREREEKGYDLNKIDSKLLVGQVEFSFREGMSDEEKAEIIKLLKQ